MTDANRETDELLDRLHRGDEQALTALFLKHRGRLRRMVRLRLDRRLQGRVDPSDVLQEAYLDVAKRARDYLAHQKIPVFLWLRMITGQRLLATHRRYFGAAMRDMGQEVSLHRGALPQATSASLAEMLLGRLSTPSQAAQRAELQVRLQEVLNAMEPIDREVLTMRHFEELNNSEVSEILGLQKSTASTRYLRALKRLKDVLASMPGFFET
jgi:RNA polymerase sigma-70 factor (ECF subfamily)